MLRVNGIKTVYENCNQKRAKVAIFISDNIDFMSEIITKTKKFIIEL